MGQSGGKSRFPELVSGVVGEGIRTPTFGQFGGRLHASGKTRKPRPSEQRKFVAEND
jgi:hypothetical protein